MLPISFKNFTNYKTYTARLICLSWSIVLCTQYVVMQGGYQGPASKVSVFSAEALSTQIEQARTCAELVRPFLKLVLIALYCGERINFADIENDSLVYTDRLRGRLLSTPDYVQSAWFYHLLRAYDALCHPEIRRVDEHMSGNTSWDQIQKAVDREGRSLVLYGMYNAVETLVRFLGDLGIDACHGAGVSNSLAPTDYVKQSLLRATVHLKDLLAIANTFIDCSRQTRKKKLFCMHLFLQRIEKILTRS